MEISQIWDTANHNRMSWRDDRDVTSVSAWVSYTGACVGLIHTGHSWMSYTWCHEHENYSGWGDASTDDYDHYAHCGDRDDDHRNRDLSGIRMKTVSAYAFTVGPVFTSMLMMMMMNKIIMMMMTLMNKIMIMMSRPSWSALSSQNCRDLAIGAKLLYSGDHN